MAFDQRFARVRTLLGKEPGYRVLSDDDVIQRGDETVCASTAHYEDWHVMGDDFADIFGRTVAEANDPKINGEMDAEERLFRRAQPGKSDDANP